VVANLLGNPNGCVFTARYILCYQNDSTTNGRRLTNDICAVLSDERCGMTLVDELTSTDRISFADLSSQPYGSTLSLVSRCLLHVPHPATRIVTSASWLTVVQAHRAKGVLVSHACKQASRACISVTYKLNIGCSYISKFDSLPPFSFLPWVTMCAFNYNLRDDDRCLSRINIECTYDDGTFDFDGLQIPVGNSYENNNGGIGGFVGPNHEYFLYCGSKYAEIAIVKLNNDTDEWEDHCCLQWDDVEDDENGFFKNIWFTQKGQALIFAPKKKYRSALMEHKDLARRKYCIKLDLSTGTFKSLTQKQFVKQRHSVLDEDSMWPRPKDFSFQNSSSESTVVGTPRPVDTQQALVWNNANDMKAEMHACLEEAMTLCFKSKGYLE
jgi:hypothetical protein